MKHSVKMLFALLAIVALTNCADIPTQPTITNTAESISQPKPSTACYIVFDAGSSGTRLFVYEKQAERWLEHAGPKVSALADPVREIRGKKNSDIDAVTTEVVSTLETIRQDGAVNEKGKKAWQAFDWSSQCHIESAMVYATAGMRIAEQENRNKSQKLWQSLKQKLQAKVGNDVKVTTRTLTGYEEGLFAWLSVRDDKKNNAFGIVEMGGASSQVTFPCEKCDNNDDAIKTVLVQGQPVKIYSYSFLGLGQDEAPKTLGMPKNCVYGIGAKKKHWKASSCANNIDLTTSKGIRDPYNYNGKKRGTYRNIPTQLANNQTWVLTGAFNYMSGDAINNCCATQGQCFEQETSCYRPIYLTKYLHALNVPETSEKMDVSWTKGAMLCEADNCLQQSSAPVCHWSDQGCL